MRAILQGPGAHSPDIVRAWRGAAFGLLQEERTRVALVLYDRSMQTLGWLQLLFGSSTGPAAPLAAVGRPH
jgi:hypothetical protein